MLRGKGLRRHWPLVAALLALVLLSIGRTLYVPAFHRDAQYYVQAALLWPSGKVSFAGSWIGDRSLTVWYYHAFLSWFGESLDSLAIGLAVLFFVNGLGVILLCALLIERPLVAATLAAALNLLAFFLQPWGIPASDAAFLTANTLLVLAWAWALRRLRPPRRPGLALFACTAAVGLLGGFRPGNLLFFAGVLATLPFAWPSPGPTGASDFRAGSRLVTPALLAIVGFAAGHGLARASWRAWVPVERPPTYIYAMVLFRPIHEYATRDDGPRTAQTLDDMGQRMTEKVDYWTTLGWGFARHGPVAGDRMMRDVGLEAVRRHAPELLRDSVAILARYLYEPPLALRVQPIDPEVDWAGTRSTLAELDAARVEATRRFGGDFFTSTRRLADNRLGCLASPRRLLPRQRIELGLPGWWFPCAVLCFGYLVLRGERALVLLWLPYLVFAFGTLAVAAFSQGFTPRYSEPFLYGFLVLAAVSLGARCSGSPRLG